MEPRQFPSVVPTVVSIDNRDLLMRKAKTRLGIAYPASIEQNVDVVTPPARKKS
jgi:hypothetical protein